MIAHARQGSQVRALPTLRRLLEHLPLFDAACYTTVMISRGIRAYMAREWRTARAAKDAYWAERIARYGPLEGLRIADELRRQALLHNPEWPDAAARKQDLLAHVRLAELFTRAASTRRS